MENGLEGKYIIKDNKKMRFGYTTGSCAAAAAKAACKMLFSKETVPVVRLMTPKGIELFLEPQEAWFDETSAGCAIQKDAGDDPDVTNGIFVLAEVCRCSRETAEEISSGFAGMNWEPDQAVVGLGAGIGVGIVTAPGLEQQVGLPAINKVPRAMIVQEIQEICREYQYSDGIQVTISVPKGAEVAEHTFNPRLGIQGGISILGTSGIVEPMSEQALIRTIEVEMKQKSVGGHKYLLITPGNYGKDYLNGHFPFDADMAVKCSNFVGQTIDLAVNMELEGILFVSHIGKIVKVAGGIMNTHSREADARMEILAACALRAGVDGDCARKILDGLTTDEGLAILKESGKWAETLQIMVNKIEFYLNHRAQNRLKIGAIVFSNVYGELGRTSLANELIDKLKEEQKIR